MKNLSLIFAAFFAKISRFLIYFSSANLHGISLKYHMIKLIIKSKIIISIFNSALWYGFLLVVLELIVIVSVQFVAYCENILIFFAKK